MRRSWAMAARMGAGRRPARQQLHPSLSLLVEEPGSFPIVGGIKDLARSLRCTKEEALNALGASRSHRKVHVKLLGGKSYSFPVKEPVLVPFEDASRAAEELGRGPLRFIDTEPSPVVVSGEEQGRRPVVVLLGHADHGKTTLLDQLSGSGRAIAGREAANMTQELRAMQVSIDDAYSVTVLDTPGQEIFHRMRSNGARVADAVILVVAADRGVEQETGECVGLLDEMGVPAVLALTKADLAEPAAALKDCREFVSIASAPHVAVSSITGTGIAELKGVLKQVIMSSPPKDVPAPPSEAVRNGITTRCSATLLDYASSAASGKRALVLIREGILRPGDSLLCGTCAGRVHRLWATEHDGGKEVDCAGPGQAVVIQCRVAHNIAGELGQPIHFMDDELAQRAAEVRKIQLALPNYERLAAPVGEGNVHAGEEEKGGSPSVVYIKADSANSLASILDALDETHLSASSATQIMSYGIGVVNPADITTAAMARATIFSFNVGCEGDARAIARSKGVPIKQFNSLPAMVDALCAAT